MSDQEIKSIAARFMKDAAKLNKWCTGRKCDTCILYYNCPNLGLEYTPAEWEIGKKVLHLKNALFGVDCGIVGKKTILKDSNGNELYTGDVVEIYPKENGEHILSIICEDNISGAFVMGLGGLSGTKQYDGVINGWNVIKVKNYSDLKIGDIYHNVKVVEEIV